MVAAEPVGAHAVLSVKQGGQTLQYVNVDRMVVLGVMLPSECSANESIEYSLQATEVNYWKQTQFLCGPGTL